MLKRALACALALCVAAVAAVCATGFSAFSSTARALPATFVAAPVFAPRSTAAPAISGTPRDGSAMSATTGTWARTPTGYAWRWLRCDAIGAGCTPIAGVTASAYELQPADVGHAVRAEVTATNAGGSARAVSDPTRPVAEMDPPANAGLPSVSGSPQVGSPLAAARGTWTGLVDAYAYAWLRCGAPDACAAIAGATGASYTPVAADTGAALRVRVTATNPGGTATATSAATASVVTAYDGRVLADAPTAYYTFEQPGATVRDDSGHGFTGSFTNPASAAGAIAGSASSARFAGGYVTLPPNLVAGGAGFTWEGWVSEDCCPGRLWQRVFDFGARPGESFWLTSDSGASPGWLAVVEAGSASFWTVAPSPGLGKWVHLAVTSDRAATRIYLDGAPAASVANGLVPSDLPGDPNNWLGRSEYAGDPLFSGRMDDVAVYDRALTAAQVAAHFAAR